MTNLSSVHSVKKRCANRHPLNGFIIFYSENYVIFTLSLPNSTFPFQDLGISNSTYISLCFLDRKIELKPTTVEQENFQENFLKTKYTVTHTNSQIYIGLGNGLITI